MEGKEAEASPLFKAAKSGEKFKVLQILQQGTCKAQLDSLYPCHDLGHLSALHVSLKERHWKVVELLLFGGLNPNKKDSNGNTALHWAVKEGAPLDLIKRLLDKDANPFLCNLRKSSPYTELPTDESSLTSEAHNDTLKLLFSVLKEKEVVLTTGLASGSSTEGATTSLTKKEALTFLYSLSAEPQRALLRRAEVRLTKEVWQKVVHLLRYDGTGKSGEDGSKQGAPPSEPKDILVMAAVVLHNFAREEEYATEIGECTGTFAFLFSLICAHADASVKKYAMHTLLALCTYSEKNKSTVACKWLRVLRQLLIQPKMEALKPKACSVLAELTRGFEEGKQRVRQEVDLALILSLLRSEDAAIRHDGCRTLTNLSNGCSLTQARIVLVDKSMELLVGFLRQNEEQECIVLAALQTIGNILELVMEPEVKEHEANTTLQTEEQAVGEEQQRQQGRTTLLRFVVESELTLSLLDVLTRSKQRRGQDEAREQALRAVATILKSGAMKAEQMKEVLPFAVEATIQSTSDDAKESLFRL
ncbi:hypothetical protein QOT17_022957 [Balamuthia mandrillaris]